MIMGILRALKGGQRGEQKCQSLHFSRTEVLSGFSKLITFN